MRILVLVSVAAISLTALPAALFAQDASTSEPTADELNRQSAPAPMNTRIMRSPDPSMPDAIITSHPGNMVAVPPTDMYKAYPVCSATVQDSCQNRGEGGAPGRSRALKHWPGKPASE